MRILFISNYYPPYERGGYEQLCRDVAERTRARGHQVAVLTSRHGVGPGYDPAVEPDTYRLLRLQPDFSSRLSPALQFYLTRPRDEAYDNACLRKLARSWAASHILIWNLEYLPRSLAITAESLPGVGVAYWLAGQSPWGPDAYWVYWADHIPRPVARQVKTCLAPGALAIMRREARLGRPPLRHVAVVSEFMRRKGLAEGTLPGHAQVIYNGVEIEQFWRPVARPEGTLHLLQAGRVSPDKGVHVSLEALRILVHDYRLTDLRLHIAGGGPSNYELSLRRATKMWGLDAHVSFLGRLPREKMPELMKGCHVLLLPTVTQEPFARVVLEAMAAGIPVVAAITGGTGELLRHEVTGLAFASGDSADLARQVRRLVYEPQLYEHLAAEAQRTVCASFSLDRMITHLEKLLAQAGD